MAFLNIIDNESLFDFQLKGNYSNWQFSVTQAPIDAMLAFSFYKYGMETITSMVAKKGYIQNGEFVVSESIDLTSYLTITKTGYFFWRNASDYIIAGVLEKGLYYLEITDGSTIMKSDLFCITGIIYAYDKLTDNLSNPLTQNTGEYLVAIR